MSDKFHLPEALSNFIERLVNLAEVVMEHGDPHEAGSVVVSELCGNSETKR